MDYFTDAPVLIVRGIAGFWGCGFYPAGSGEPIWCETVLEGRGNALAYTVQTLETQGYRVEPEGRAAIGNPTYALAAAALTRGGSSSAPAAQYAR